MWGRLVTLVTCGGLAIGLAIRLVLNKKCRPGRLPIGRRLSTCPTSRKSSRRTKKQRFSCADDRSFSSALSTRRQANLRVLRLMRGDRGRAGWIRRLDFDLLGLLLYIAIKHADEKAVTQGRNHAARVAVRGRNQDRPRLQASQTLPASFRDESRDGAGKPIGRDSHKGPSLEECARHARVEQRVASGRRVMET